MTPKQNKGRSEDQELQYDPVVSYWHKTDIQQNFAICFLWPSAVSGLYQISGTVLGGQNEKMNKTWSWASKSLPFDEGVNWVSK